MAFTRRCHLWVVLVSYALHGTFALPQNPTCQPSPLCSVSTCAAKDLTSSWKDTSFLSRRTNLQSWPDGAQRLPSGENDLRRKTQQELMDWILQRTQDKDVTRIIKDLGPGSTVVFLTRSRRNARLFSGPTSVFSKAGNAPFTWAVQDMSGCTTIFAVRESKSTNDGETDSKNIPTNEGIPSSGIYMAHIWEVPGFSGSPNKGLRDQFAAYGTGLLVEGFPNNYLRDVDHESTLPPTFQDSLAMHRDVMRGGKALIIHPQLFPYMDEDGYFDGPKEPEPTEPQYPEHVENLKSTIEDILSDGATSRVERYLYLPNRGDTPYEEPAPNRVGKTIFQYDPNFDGRKTGMLLIGDGGTRGHLRADGKYEPGLGGPFFYDFGPAEADIE